MQLVIQPDTQVAEIEISSGIFIHLQSGAVVKNATI
jgi:hypothetical protein